MRFSLRLVRLLSPVVVCSLALSSAFAQKPASASTPAGQTPPGMPKMPPAPKPPALIDPAGPAISLQTSETLFDIAVALNACGYDNGLNESDPIRKHIREVVNQATEQSADARDARDELCQFVDMHHSFEASRDLSQYISLALYVTPPPDLAPSVDEENMPPDSTQVVGILPLLRRFAKDIELHAIWVANHQAYDALINQLHNSLTKMIVDTNIYLKMPASTYDGSRFLVVLEPMLSPAETNARVYGTDYVVVASPVEGAIRMQEVRHTYLHYEIEPLLYARAGAIDRLLPFLKVVRDAPLDFVYRSDIVSLVIESMILSIEARTMETGVKIPPIPPGIALNTLEPIYREHQNAVNQDSSIREKLVAKDMAQGYVLTQYFYNQMVAFEKTPVSLKDSIGEMVYGMDVEQEVHRAKNVQFVEQGTTDVINRASFKPHGLDLAEQDLSKGDAGNASTLAQTALKEHTADPARANFILARASLLQGNVDDAQAAFKETIRLSNDPRMLAWSHIYLGRILDVEDSRDDAVAQYNEALTVRDGQPDTKSAAEKGLKQPFALPRREVPDDGDDDPPSKNPTPPATPAAPATTPPGQQ